MAEKARPRIFAHYLRWDTPEGFVRLLNHFDLATSGLTPQIVVPTDGFFDKHDFSIPMEKMRGKIWADLEFNENLPLLTHLKIAKIVTEQVQWIYQEYGLLIMDSGADNVFISGYHSNDPTDLTVKHIDLILYDRKLGGERIQFSQLHGWKKRRNKYAEAEVWANIGDEVNGILDKYHYRSDVRNEFRKRWPGYWSNTFPTKKTAQKWTFDNLISDLDLLIDEQNSS